MVFRAKKNLFILAVAFMTFDVFAIKNNIELKSPARTSSSVYLTWNFQTKIPTKVRDYEVYVDGKKCALTAMQQQSVINPLLSSYKNSFLKSFDKKTVSLKNGMINPDVRFYCVSDLESGKKYNFCVKAVNTRGKILFSSQEISVCTLEKGAVLNVLDYGAKVLDYDVNFFEAPVDKNFIRENTRSIQKAIDECEKNGTVYIPKGMFLCGGLNLKSDMTLKIDGTLLGSPYADDYEFGFLMYPYYTDYRYWGLINAKNAQNLILSGNGIVDANGWQKIGTYFEEGDDELNPLLKYEKGNNRTVYEKGILAKDCALTYLSSNGKTVETADDKARGYAYATRSTTVILKNIQNLLIENLTFINPANHMINILDSFRITIAGIKEFSYDINNGDGIGFICSSDACVFNSFIDAGDDCIVFSAGVGKSAAEVGLKSVRNIEIFGNYFHHGHGGVAFGSHTAMGIENVYIHDNIFNHTDIAFRIKSAPANGGFVKNVHFEYNSIANVKRAFSMSTEYNDSNTVSQYGAAESQAVFSDIKCNDCTVYKNSSYPVYIFAKKETPHHDINFKNVQISQKGETRQYIKNCENYIFE